RGAVGESSQFRLRLLQSLRDGGPPGTQLAGPAVGSCCPLLLSVDERFECGRRCSVGRHPRESDEELQEPERHCVDSEVSKDREPRFRDEQGGGYRWPAVSVAGALLFVEGV